MNKKDIVIVGGGGLSREVKWLIEECNKTNKCWNILGWVSKEPVGSIISGLPVLGDDDWLIKCDYPIDVVIGIGDGKTRKRIVSRLRVNHNISFPTIVSPSAELSDSVILGEGSIITSKSVLTVDVNIGSFFYCNLGCTIGHDCRFSDYVTLNPGVNVSGNVFIDECASVGTGAAIIQGMSIGKNAVIGAGAVVIHDVFSDCTAVGVPAIPLEKKI